MALADHYERGLLQMKDIAARKEIPRQFLEQIFNRLVNAAIIKSVRGSKGGYTLASPPSEIKVIDVIEILEGGLQLVPKENRPTDVIYELFCEAEKKLHDSFNVTLAELVLHQRSLGQNAMYYI